MTTLLAQRDTEIVQLKDALQMVSREVLGALEVLVQENASLRSKVIGLDGKVQDLTHKLLKAHETENECMTLMLHKLPGPSSLAFKILNFVLFVSI